MGEKEDKRRNRKRRVFKRDGWQDQYGEWFAMCSFDCGEVISWHTSQLNLHPLKKRDGGTYRFENTRLACRPCVTKENQLLAQRALQEAS